MKTNQVIIFDTTLRDGEQSPGHSMDMDEKIDIAQTLEAMGVNAIEAGFACSCAADFNAIRAIAENTRETIVCSLARCVDGDIEAAADALKPAKRKRIHVFIATSPIHRQYKLKASKQQIVERAVAGVRFARTFTDDVEFSAEDAYRTEIDYLIEVIRAVIDAGATTVNLPDTVGYATPESYATMIRTVHERAAKDRAVISTHCHNDLGMAVASSLAGVSAGARQIECTINGIGERAGNAAMEEVVMALKTRRDIYGVETSIDTRRFLEASRKVAAITGSSISRNKAIVGRNAFAHESGIHQHGMIAHRETYEIMQPQDVGFAQSELILGRHSGRTALQERIKAMGIDVAQDQWDTIAQAFKTFAATRKAVDDNDIRRIVAECTVGERAIERAAPRMLRIRSASAKTTSQEAV